MKKLIFILIAIFAVLFSSCSGAKYRKSLIEADSLCSTNPREAIAMLGRMKQEMTEASEQERMYYRLLQIKAADKAYIRHTSDSIILELVEYYETEGDKKLLSEAYYYAGSTYRDLNDAPRALEYYQKSEEVLPDNADLHDISKLHNQKGTLFFFQYLNDEAIKEFRQVYRFESIRKDTTMMIWSLMNIGSAFKEENKFDSCLCYYQKAYNLAKSQNDTIFTIKIMGQMASFYLKKKDFDKAKACLIPALALTDSSHKSAFYTIASNIYMNTEEYDSAYFYCKEALQIGTIHAKQSASRKLMEIYLTKKDYDKSKKYLKLNKALTDSINIITATESVNRMNSLYNYNLREKENLILKIQNSDKQSIIIIITAFLFVISSFSGIFFIRNRQRQKIHLERLRRLKKELYEQSAEYIQENEKKINDLELKIKRASDENLMLKDRIEQQRADLILANETAVRKKTKKESEKVRIAATNIYKTIQEHIEKEKVINSKEWDLLDEIINIEITGFKDNLYSYYNISQHEYHICMLIRIGIVPKDMSILLGCTISAVSKARKRLQEKIFSNEGTPKDFDNFVSSL